MNTQQAFKTLLTNSQPLGKISENLTE